MVTVPASSRLNGSRAAANPQIVSAIILAALVVLIVSLLTARGASHANSAQLHTSPVAAQPNQLPLTFVPNVGQADPQVHFEAQAMGGTLFFTPSEVVLSLPVADNTTVVRMQFEGAATQPDLQPGTQLAGTVNFLEGSQPEQWHTNLPTYSGMTYRQLYDGINLHYDGVDGQLKSTYVVAANADPSRIRWHYAGVTNTSIDAASGDLHMTLAGTQAPLIERAPIAWQDHNGQRTAIDVRYELQPNGSVGFALGAYNQALPLTIDPTLEYSTFIGGTGADRINAVAIDPTSGDVFVTGETSSAPFPGAPTTIGTTGAGSFPNIFVARIRADGTGTVYRTVIGGTNSDKGLAIAITSGGIANVVGYSFSNNFPTTASTAVSSSYYNNGDIIALALASNGTLGYSSYLGGTSTDTGYSIAASGNFLYIAGSTDGTVTGESSGPVGGTDAIVYKIDKTTSGSAGQIYARRLGGLFNDTARAIALDNSGNVYVTGVTNSTNTTFATVGTPYQGNNAGGSDLFITKLDGSGAITYNSFFGGSDTDEGLGITVEPAGNLVYITGRTLSASFPGASGSPTGQDAFITKIDLATNTIAYSHYLGSPGVDVGNAIAVDATGAAYVVGSTSSTSFYSQNPLPEMASNGGNVDGFITRFDPAGNPSYSSRIGGTFDDVATGVATFQAAQGTKVYVAGYTNSANFLMTTPPTTIQSTIGGSDDGFVVRIANTRPQIDLNDATIGNGIDVGPVTWTEAGGAVAGSGPVAIANSTGLTVIDADSATLAYAEVRFVASKGTGGTAIVPPDTTSESLSVTLSGGITGSYNTATGILRLTNGGSSTLSDFQTVLRSVTYHNSSQSPTVGQRLLAVEVNDGIDGNTPLAFSTINVVASNDPPVVTVPGSAINTNEEATTTISGVSVSDVDAGSANIKVTISVPTGVGTLTATASGAASVTPTSGASIDIIGTLVDVNATLSSLSFTGATDFNTASGSPVSITVLANDQGNTPTPAQTDQKTVSVTVNPVNDPPFVPALPASVTTNEDTAKTINIVTDLGMNDTKDTNAPAAAGGAAFPPVTSITVTSPPTSGAITSINTTAGTFIYTPSSNASGSDSFAIQVCDLGTPGSACSSQTVNVTINPVNDPPTVTVPGSAINTNEEATTTISGVSVSDVDAGSANIKVTISVPTGVGTLTATASGAASVTPTSGVSIDIVGTLVDVNASLSSLSFTGATDFNTASGSPVSITVLANDQGNTPTPAQTDQKTVGVTVNPVNDPPFVPALPVSVTTNEDTAKTINIVTDLGMNDTKDTNAPAAAGGAAFPPVTSITVTSPPTSGAITSINTTAGTFIYTPSANASGSDSFTIQVCDLGTPGSACSSQTVNVTINPVNDPPVITLSAPALSYSENGTAISIESAATVTDGDSANFNGGSLSASITSLGDSGDTITLVPGGNITLVGTTVQYSGNPIGTVSGGTNGTSLTISFSSASVTPSVAAELIQQLEYSNTLDSFAQGTTTAKVITISINDGGSTPNTGSATRSLNLSGVNDAPVLDTSGTMVLSPIVENQTTSNGTLVSTIIASAGGTRITDPDTGALQGIAIIDADTTNGTWQFSINNGTNWTTFGSLSATNATILTSNTRIRFVPNLNFNGTINPGITFVAWDQTSGSNGATGVDSTPGGGKSAFSISTTIQTASISVTSVNQAPVLDNTGTMTLTSIAEDVPTTSNPGTLVSTIIASAGGTRITDPDTGALQGIAIIAADSTNGTWQFSINNGTNWTPISAPSNGTAVLLASDGQTRVRFLPNPNYNGTVDPGITFRAWDQTSSANGATLVDVSVNGDPSAFSVATETASIVVTAVNDQPTATDDTANVPKNSPNTTIDVLANDSFLPDTGETLVVTAVGTAQHGTVTIASGGTAVLYTPAIDYSGQDSFTYTISDGNGGSATATVRIQVGQYYVLLPLVLGEPIKPDLEISNITITPAGPNYLYSDKVQISVTVRNTGTIPTGGFYTELYINPSVAPTQAGILWNTVCSLDPCQGITWYVKGGLAGGQSITLTSTPDSYYSTTKWTGSFTPGTKEVYAYVDSWNGPSDPEGFIKERDESNNMAVIRGLNVSGFGTSTQPTFFTVPHAALTTDRDMPRDQVLR